MTYGYPLDELLASQVPHRLAQGMSAPDFHVAVGANEQYAIGACMPGEVLQEIEARFIRPVQIVYEEGCNAVSDGNRDSWLATPATQNRRDPRQRAPRGYIIPATQPDFPTATKFVAALLKAGVAVIARRLRFASTASRIRPARSSSKPRSRSARTCSTCSSRSTIPTTIRRTTSPAGRSPCRWG